MGVMDEVPEQLGLKGKHISKMGVKMMLKKSSGDPKCWYVRIPNYSEDDNVPVLNLIKDVVCRGPDSSVSRASVRYSEGPRFSVRLHIKKNITNEGASIMTHGEQFFICE
jgi:hypothetical protein